ncbi:MAG: CinA family protein [Bdellovibrionota bacterium]
MKTPRAAEEAVLQLLKVLSENKLTLSLAESCTGGLLSALITENAGVSPNFLGSVVSYSNEAKENVLGVRRDSLHDEGAVSEAVARQMAQGVRLSFQSDWSASITGVAGPSGGTPTKPVGTVWIAVAGPGFEESRKFFFEGDRKEIQAKSAESAAGILCESIRQKKV